MFSRCLFFCFIIPWLGASVASGNTCWRHIEQVSESALDEAYLYFDANASDLNRGTFDACIDWILDRTQYNALKSRLGYEPCPQNSREWKGLNSALAPYAKAEFRRVCKSSHSSCNRGCGVDTLLGLALVVRRAGVVGLQNRVNRLYSQSR